MGDLNSKVGCNNAGKERSMGREGLGCMNDNGSRLIDTCVENDLVIGGTLFKHKTIHKVTWTSPSGKTQNQIDHIMIKVHGEVPYRTCVRTEELMYQATTSWLLQN